MSNFMQRLTGRRKKTAGRNSSRASKTVSIYLENHHEGTGLADISEDAILEDEDLQVKNVERDGAQ